MLLSRKKKIHLYLVLIFGLALLIGVGYALLTSNLNIFGQTTIQKASWDVHFENLNVKEGSVTATIPASIDANGTTVNYTVSLNMPGDYYEFTVDEVNKGTIDAMVSSIVKTGITEEQAKYINYSVTYSDGTTVSEKQLLAADQTEKIKVRVEFKRDIEASDLNDLSTTSQTLNLSFNLNYTQADDSGVAVVHPVCRRATTLHNDGTTTYGSLGTKGTLVSGDAFDCDVNGDGVYDSEVERFYYVSDLDENISKGYAILIYYSNVSLGMPDNVSKYLYTSGGSTSSGPTVAVKQLPTSTQWKNISLASNSRNLYFILHPKEVAVGGFDYSGYSARLATKEDLVPYCEDEEAKLTKCAFLAETGQSMWLANSYGKYGYQVGVYMNIKTLTITTTAPYQVNMVECGVRPTIEVLKSKIFY